MLFILPASFLLNQDSDSDQSLNLSDVNVSLSQDKASEASKRLSRSDSWTFYDTTPSARQPETIDELDKVSGVEEEGLEKSCEKGDRLTIDRTSYASNESHASIQNSLYENLLPSKADNWREPPLTSTADTRQQSSKSLLFEFDPFARTSDENVYSNYESNDLMLLEALLATNDSPSRGSSTVELHVDAEEEDDDDDLTHPGISLTPPEPPKRFDSLPKNEYDEVEGVEQPDKVVSSKNPPLLPKLAHLVTKKQPAVPPRKPSLKNNSADNPSVTPPKPAATTTTPANNVEANVTSASSAATKVAEDHRKVSVIQKLKKLRGVQESTVHAIKPNVISFVKTGSKFLSRTREHISDSSAPRPPRMERPKVNAPHNRVTHRGMVYR